MTIKELMGCPEVNEITSSMPVEDLVVVVKLLEGFLGTKEEIDKRYNLVTTDEQLKKFAAEVARILSEKE